jgi:formate hydrogenlyase subunit 6/NADH:ubiquinone oxidoreductase subunit I
MTTHLNRRGHHVASVVQPRDCIGCLQCAVICPDAAIEIDEEVS